MSLRFSLPLGGHSENAVAPADLGAAGAQSSFLSMVNADQLYFCGYYAAGASGNGPILVVEAASDAAGTGASAVALSEIWTKVGSGEWTRVPAVDRQSTVASYDTDAVGGDDEALEFIIRIHDGDLAEGKTHVRINNAAAGGNRTGYVHAVSDQRSYAGKNSPAL